ncbi:MAG: cytidylate kinase-like family protein [Anaerolineaceae bacterium]|nr:cytidylate kinase-like family protein [Anaerolineaceae bacterium]
MAVITISRQFGSGGDEIVDRVCKLLGYRCFDQQLLIQTAREAGLSESEIIDYSEENYKVENFMDRLFSRTSLVGQVRRTTGRLYSEPTLTGAMAFALVNKAIETACKVGNIVIVGRGGQVVLKDYSNVLHVRIEAPLEDRLMRVRSDLRQKESGDILIDERRRAHDLINARDSASADYLNSHFGVDWSDPTLYHVVLNSAKLPLDLAAQFIVAMVRAMEPPAMEPPAVQPPTAKLPDVKLGSKKHKQK